LEDGLTVAVEFGSEFAGKFFDAGCAGVLDDVLDRRRRESRVEFGSSWSRTLAMQGRSQ
jgi:hypothetical protein